VYGSGREIFVANEKKAAALKRGLSSGVEERNRRECMILTTTPTIEGFPIQKYVGILSSESFLEEGFFQERERAMWEARERALDQLEARAVEAGANAVVGVSIDFEVQPGFYYVMATGTAVVIPDGE
jgi:uncharacterized protein YbjQ (UPF0145 family)